MRCINKFLIAAILSVGIFTTGCGALLGGSTLAQNNMRFQDNSLNSNFNFLIGESGSGETASPFAQDLCVVSGNIGTEADGVSSMPETTSAALFDLTNKNTIYAKDVDARVYPASLTKVMTALVALENASPETMLTASSNVYMTDASAQSVGLKEGDTMTLDQALHLLLIYSANDVAIMIAENIGGTLANYIEMMNEEAAALGATNTNFINSNGLSDENHYTTAYDMYLIFNRAITFSTFNEIINMSSYSTFYHNAAGDQKEITVNSTNMYLQNVVTPPSGVNVIGGKTGTTMAAGHCLALMARDTSGRPYIAIVMKAIDQDALYKQMNSVLNLIP